MRIKQFYPIVALLAFSSATYAQVGINTATPTSTLEVVAKNATGATTNVDGLLVPRVDRQRAQSMTTIPTSTMIYVNNATTGTQTGIAVNINAVGYYYYNGLAWVKLENPSGAVFSNLNIYNGDGSLLGNRIVTQGANTLSFLATAVNAFSVDGSTFSADAANHRVGIGTTAPLSTFHVVSPTQSLGRYSLIDAPTGIAQNTILALRNTTALATGNYSLLGFTNNGPTAGGQVGELVLFVQERPLLPVLKKISPWVIQTEEAIWSVLELQLLEILGWEQTHLPINFTSMQLTLYVYKVLLQELLQQIIY